MNDPVLTPAGGQPANPFQQATTQSGQQPAAAPVGVQGDEQPQYLTRQEAEALRQNILREAQSLVDKSSSRTEKKVQEIREQMSANGVQLSADQEATLRANLERTPAAPSTAQPVAAQPAQAPQLQAQIDPALAIASAVMERAGVTILETDPEFEKIKPHIKDGSVPDALAMLAALNDAISAKKTREAAKANPSARLPLGGAQPAGHPVTTAREAWNADNLFK